MGVPESGIWSGCSPQIGVFERRYAARHKPGIVCRLATAQRRWWSRCSPWASNPATKSSCRLTLSGQRTRTASSMPSRFVGISIGYAGPGGLPHPVAAARWDADAVRDALRGCVVDHLHQHRVPRLSRPASLAASRSPPASWP
jgi:hypothetical protein